MSLCRDPVIFLLSEAVKLIEESPAKKSKEYLETGWSLGQKYPSKKSGQLYYIPTLGDKIMLRPFILFSCQCLLFSLSQIQSFDFFLTSHQKVVIL